MEQYEFFVCAIFLALFCVASFLGAFRLLRRARLIEDVPTANIRSAPQGYVELEGHALPWEKRGTQNAPLSHDCCVWWDFRVEQRRRTSKGGHRWVRIEEGTSRTPFVIEDDTGRCIVSPKGATARVDFQRTWYGSSSRPAPGLNGGPASGRYRYTERMIIPGERLYALGLFQSEHDDNTGLVHVIGNAGSASRPFILSTRPQGHLTAGFRAGASKGFAVFLASGAGLMWLLAARGVF
jgi:hypothetical protein